MPIKGSSVARILSYTFDWLLILIVAALGGVLSTIRGATHAFSLSDPRISYPFYPDTVSFVDVIIVALVVPAVLIAVLSLVFTPSGYSSPSSLIWRRKLWNWNAGWLGLGLSLAGAFFVTEALKDVVGKPRPNLLARCDPDVSKISAYAVSGLGKYLEEAPILVTAGICMNTDASVVGDGFASWPSGHSSSSVSGLLYFSLWICGKFGMGVPSATSVGSWRTRRAGTVQFEAATPPVYLLIAALIPVSGAIYICASRWADNQHNGWDILGGATIGVFFAWLGYRLYHPPLQDLLGASWDPRSKARAFYSGITSEKADNEPVRHEGETVEREEV